MQTYLGSGDSVDIVAPSGGVTSGSGVLVGTHLFGVARRTAAQGETVALQLTGRVTLPKTSALAIAVGDLVYWVAGSGAVNRTATGNKLVGIAVSAAANPSPTVQVLLLPNGVAVA